MLPAIDAAVLQMVRGERARLYSPPSFAYAAPNFLSSRSATSEHLPGSPGISGELRARLEAVADVEIDVELVDYDNAKGKSEMRMAERMAAQLRRKEAGNSLHRMGAIAEAVAKWELSLSVSPGTDLHGRVGNPKYDMEGFGKPGDPAYKTAEKVAEDIAYVNSLKLATHLNLASGYLKLGQPTSALAHAAHALEIQPRSLKGLFRRAQCRMAIRPVDADLARADLMTCAAIDPRSKEVRAALEELQRIVRLQKAEEQRMYGGMFAREEGAAGRTSA